MSQPEKLNEGINKEGEEIRVVLPSDKAIIVGEIPLQSAQPTSQTESSSGSSLDHIKQQFSSFFASQSHSEGALSEASGFDFSQHFSKFSQCWRTFDSQAARTITEFKRDHVLTIGDLPVRSVCMAVSTGLVYAIFGRRNPSLLGRTRNLAISFALNGSFWVPQTFNPFLFRQNRI